MERILSDNDKIRKAEEIYYRRNHRNVSINEALPPKTKTYLGSKILLEMLILVILAIIVFAVKNKDYIFTQSFLENISQYNVNLTEKIDSILAYFNLDIIKNEENTEIENQEVTEPVEQEKNTTEEIQINNAEVKQTEGAEVQNTSEQSNVSDVVSLKNSYSFIKPIEGIVSSGFGSRVSQYQNVTGEHKGIDLSADSGTVIKSAMSGTVTQVSTEGDYGNHIRITQNNITTLYAHCQDIYVTEGQEIIQGQEIATVGSTGNSTGPHLHFEIRIDNDPINPAEIIVF